MVSSRCIPIVAAAFCVVPATGPAQELAVGLNAAVHRATPAGARVQPIATYQAAIGGVLIITLSDVLALRPELNYTPRAAHFPLIQPFREPGGPWQEMRVIQRFEPWYLELPILARLELPMNTAGVHSYAVVGPYVAYQVRCDVLSTIELPNKEPHTTPAWRCADPVTIGEGVRFAAHRWDWGGQLGIGMAVGIGKLRFSVEARYTRGLRSVPTGGGWENNLIGVVTEVTWHP